MKGKVITISILGVLVGRVLNRILSNYFGENGPLALVFTIVILFLCCDFYLLITKRFLASLIIFAYISPLLIGFIGMYIDNYTILGCSIGSIFIIYPIFIKWIKRLDRDDIWNHKGLW